ncbi:hypothetical protein AX16_009719 [Volvariella volvacea WC 439]|nr:hypothetical protein AX16_009719 [Volvariella volvacea WC 439]
MYDGDDRPGADECHPDTRREITHDITSWVTNTETMGNKILWLRGAVGTGKTTLARTVASSLDRMGLLVGDFFFFRADKLRNHTLNVIPTLAYRMSMRVPQFGAVVERSIAQNASILNAPLKEQWEALILRPLAESSSFYHFTGRPLIVIDGIDECSSVEDQDTLLSYVSILAHQSPFTFLLSSRPDPHLDAAIYSIMQNQPQMFRSPITLGDTDDARRDIETVVRDELSLGSPAPEFVTEVVDLISWYSAGQFSYAIQAASYLRRALPCASPLTRDFLVSPSAQKSVFSTLDEQYNSILRRVINTLSDQGVTALRLALFHLSNIRSDSIEVISALWGQDVQLLQSVLSLLPSVLLIPSSGTVDVKIHHPSFRDYLTNPTRSGRYSPVPSPEYLQQAFKRSLEWAGHRTQYTTLPYMVFSLWLDCAPKFHIAGLDMALIIGELSRFNFNKWIRTWYVEQRHVQGTSELYKVFRDWLEKSSSKVGSKSNYVVSKATDIPELMWNNITEIIA